MVRRLLRLLAGGLVVGALVLLVLGWYVDRQLVAPLDRVDHVFDGLRKRPAQSAAQTVLLVVEDPDRPADGWLPHHGTAVTVQVVELDGARRHVRSVALPLAARWPGGQERVDATVARRSPARLVGHVEALTGTRVDHLVTLDRDYLRVRAEREHGMQLPDGWLSPSKIVARFDAPARTTAQVRRQQQVLGPLVGGTLHQEFRKHPWELWSALRLFSRHAGVEDGWSAPGMALTVVALRDLRSAQIVFDVVPVRDGELQRGDSARTTSSASARIPASSGW